MANVEKLEPKAVRDPEPWKRCPSTHCLRRGECASPHECCVKPKPFDGDLRMAKAREYFRHVARHSELTLKEDDFVNTKLEALWNILLGNDEAC